MRSAGALITSVIKIQLVLFPVASVQFKQVTVFVNAFESLTFKALTVCVPLGKVIFHVPAVAALRVMALVRSPIKVKVWLTVWLLPAAKSISLPGMIEVRS